MTMQTETFQPLEQFGGTVLGSFSKGIDRAAQLNFGLSGGANCDTGCRHHPAHYPAGADRAGICYAKVVELRHDRVQLADKLARHEAAPASAIVGKALHELEREKLHGRPARPWFRISTNGAVPKPATAIADRLFLPRLRSLLEFCRQRGTPVHFPVESAEKAAFYREHVGALAVVRESIQTPDMSPATIAGHAIPAGPVSFTAGESVTPGKDKRKRILAAADAAAAAWAKLTGRKTIVCPAVRVSFLSRTKAGKAGRDAAAVEAWRKRAKCGSCTACALAHVDIVYPAH
jgi:hypothetical protein